MQSNTRDLDESAKATLFYDGHTASNFEAVDVTDDQLRELYAMTCLTPTATNSTPLRIAYVRTAEAKARLLSHLAEGNRPKTESAPVVAVLATDDAFMTYMGRLAPYIADPTIFYPTAAAERQAADFNAALQAGAFIIAVRALGLDAGPMNGIDTAGIDAEFFGDTTWRSFMVVNIGYASADGVRPRSARLEFDEAVKIL